MQKILGKVAIIMGRFYTWTHSEDYNNVYYADTSNPVNCYDMSDYEHPIPLEKVNSIEKVNNTEGSYYYTSNRIYVNMNYYTTPTSTNCAVIMSYGEAPCRILNANSSSNWVVHFKDLIFVGAQNYAIRIDKQGDDIFPYIFIENCKFLCGQYVNSGHEYVDGVSGGVRISHARAIIKNCIASNNMGDGFAYVENAFGFELDCISCFNGRSNKQNYNGSTAHNNCVVIRINGIYFNNYGPNVADVLERL